MWQLFLDASTSKPFLLLCKGDEIQCFKEMDSKGSNSLIIGLQEIFQAFPLTPIQIEKIFVGSGPGSFIGLRSGLTIAKMFELSFQTPIIMLPSMYAISLPIQGKITSLIDGKSRGVFITVHEKVQDEISFIQKPKLLSAEEARKLEKNSLCSLENQSLKEKTSLPIQQGYWDQKILLQLMHSNISQADLFY